MHFLFNPGRFSRIASALLPWLSIVTIGLLGTGTYFALWASPPDYQQGESVRIMYVHVPAAWMSLFVYTSIAIASAASLIWKNPLSDMIGKSAAPIGAGFTLICLVTGSLWGKPIWGTWWVWDARLTSVLILFFFYLGYMALLNAFDNPARGAKAAAILSLVGFINVPIVKFSVDFWNTLHQPASIIRMEGPSIDTSMLIPLLIMITAFTFFFFTLLLMRTQIEIAERKLLRKRHLPR